MWKRNNEIYNGNSIIFDGRRIFNPTEDTLKKAGYVWEEPVIPEPIELPKHYSTLKIIRALGDDWQSYKTQLETAGVLDQFFAANFLSADDPVFVAFIANVPEELQARLDNECIWEEN
ncbi:MAG: hypothetical protein IKA71_07240 [Lentisphaeria bacterium]|nr:hypothetical protein [Lentisphaeria bacterium]